MAQLRISEFLEPPSGPPTLGLSQIFEEEPVSLDAFVTDKRFLSNPPLSEPQYRAVQHIERIYLPDTYKLMAAEWPYWSEPIRMTNFITLQWGKGSGKDHICRIAALRIAYLLQCLRSPQEYFGLPSQDTIHMLNVASSSAQANQAFFIPMTRVVKHGWFAQHAAPKPGLGLISWDKNVEMVSGHADAESQEGLNLILGVADEVDAFKTKDASQYNRSGREPQKSVESILKMIRGSAVTRFPESFKNVRISYPRYVGSPIQKLTVQARKDNEKHSDQSRHYVSGPMLTWQVNPRYEQFDLVHIPETEHLVPNLSSIIEDYQEDAAMAKSMYECSPSRAIDSYFRNMDAIRNCMSGDVQPMALDYITREITSRNTGIATTVWEPTFEFHSGFIPISGARYAIHADMAIKSDRAGVAMSHVSRYIEQEQVMVDEEGGEHTTVVRIPVVKTDFVFGFEANLKISPPREIQISWVRTLVFELVRRGFDVASVSYDGFQSTDSMQILESNGIKTSRLSTDRDEGIWKNFRDVAYEQRWEAPVSLLLLTELESLGRFGGKVDHPPSGSKDLADATACSVVRAIEVGGEETGEQAYPGVMDITVGYADPALQLMGYEDIDPFSPDAVAPVRLPPYQVLGRS